MLFNSPVFLLLFLPITLIGFYTLAAWIGRRVALTYLLIACLAFYAYSSLFNFFIFVGSVTANFLLGFAIAYFKRRSRSWLIGGLMLNLSLIGYFKYSGFIVSNFDQLTSTT